MKINIHNIDNGTTVYGMHPNTGEKFYNERYTVVGKIFGGIDGDRLIVRDCKTGKEHESSTSYLCK